MFCESFFASRNQTAGFNALEAALSKEDVTLEELLETGEVLNAARCGIPQLLSLYSTCSFKGRLLKPLLRFLLGDETHPKAAEFAFICSELLRCEIDEILEEFLRDGEVAEALYAVLRKEELQVTAAGYFAGAVSSLMNRRPEAVVRFVFLENEYTVDLIRHIRHRSVAELISRFLKCDYGGSLFAIEKMNILEMIVHSISERSAASAISNSVLVLRSMIDTAQDLRGWKIYMALLLQSSCIEHLTSLLVNSNPSLVSAASDIIAALFSLEDFDDIYEFPFEDISRASKKHPSEDSREVFDVFELMNERMGSLAEFISSYTPNGGQGAMAILSVMRLLAVLTTNSTPKLERSFVTHNVFSLLCSLFSRCPWASLLQSEVCNFVKTLLSSCSSGLKYDLLVTAALPSCLYSIAKQPDVETGRGKTVRKGSLGYVTLIGRELEDAAEKQPFVAGCLERSDVWLSFQREYLCERSTIERRKLGEDDPPTAPETPSASPLSPSSSPCADKAGLQTPREEPTSDLFTAPLYWKLPLGECAGLPELD